MVLARCSAFIFCLVWQSDDVKQKEKAREAREARENFRYGAEHIPK